MVPLIVLAAVHINVLGPGRFVFHDQLRGPTDIDASATIERFEDGTWSAVDHYMLRDQRGKCIRLDSGNDGVRAKAWMGGAGRYRVVATKCGGGETYSAEFVMPDRAELLWVRAGYTDIADPSRDEATLLALLRDPKNFTDSPQTRSTTENIVLDVALTHVTGGDIETIHVRYDDARHSIEVSDDDFNRVGMYVTDPAPWNRLVKVFAARTVASSSGGVEISVYGPGRFGFHDTYRGPTRIDTRAQIELLEHGAWHVFQDIRLLEEPAACVELGSGAAAFRPRAWTGPAGTYRIVAKSCDRYRADVYTSSAFVMPDDNVLPWVRGGHTDITDATKAEEPLLALLRDPKGFHQVSEKSTCTPDVALDVTLHHHVLNDHEDVRVTYDAGCGVVTVAAGPDVLQAGVTDRAAWNKLAKR